MHSPQRPSGSLALLGEIARERLREDPTKHPYDTKATTIDTPRSLAKLFTTADLDAAVATHPETNLDILGRGWLDLETPLAGPKGKRIAESLGKKWRWQFFDLARVSPAMYGLVTTLGNETGSRVSARVQLDGADSQEPSANLVRPRWTPHADRLIVNLFGRREWRTSDELRPYPREERNDLDEQLILPNAHFILPNAHFLEPGQILYIPAGVIYEPVNPKSTSMSLLLTVYDAPGEWERKYDLPDTEPDPLLVVQNGPLSLACTPLELDR